MISNKTHTEVSTTGKPVYILETYLKDPETGALTDVLNKDYSREIAKIPFHRGIGKTTSRAKAQLLSEQHQYVVKLHKDVEPWPEAGENQRAETMKIDEETDSLDIDDE